MNFVFSGEDFAEERYYVPKVDGDDLPKAMKRIYDLCHKIKSKIEERGTDYCEFVGDEEYRDALTMEAYEVAVLAIAIPVTIREETYDEVPWRDFEHIHLSYGFMLYYRHEDRMDMWKFIMADLPLIEKFCEKRLNNPYWQRDEISGPTLVY